MAKHSTATARRGYAKQYRARARQGNERKCGERPSDGKVPSGTVCNGWETPRGAMAPQRSAQQRQKDRGQPKRLASVFLCADFSSSGWDIIGRE